MQNILLVAMLGASAIFETPTTSYQLPQAINHSA